MEVEPADMVPTLPPARVIDLDWRWDWLGNTTEWHDDAQAFYERSIGAIQNGVDVEAEDLRPSALYFSTNIPEGGVDLVPAGQAGWLELEYGDGGNVTSMTVHGRCEDAPMEECADDDELGPQARAAHMREVCACEREQFYEYRWDELNRLSEARRWDRDAPATGWSIQVRQRYRYDGTNVRTIKQTAEPTAETDVIGHGVHDERIALYVYPGAVEIRGLERGASSIYVARSAMNDHVESQYVVAGARLVWRHEGGDARDRRLTVPLRDIVHTTGASVDLLSGQLIEASTYLPNGARETLQNDSTDLAATEGRGFTGKEADEEVGVTYFGERYLIPRMGRWATPDPLAIHASGAEEAMNSYHYVAGNLLQARDPLGLCACGAGAAPVQSDAASRTAFQAAVGTLVAERVPSAGMLTRVSRALVDNPRRVAISGEFNPDLDAHAYTTFRGQQSVLHYRPETLSQAAPNAGLISHEVFHVYIELAETGTSRHDGEIRAFMAEGAANFRAQDTGERMSDPRRVFEEALSSYVERRTQAYIAASHRLNALSGEVGSMSSAELEREISTILGSHDRLVNGEYYGYDHQDPRTGSRVTHPEAVLSEAQMREADRLFLGGASPEGSEVFAGEIATLRAAQQHSEQTQ
jgi:RHS repeat-associated protein